MLIVKAGTKYGVLEETGKQVIAVKYDSILKANYFGNRYPVQLNGKWGLVSDKGKEVTAIKYQAIGEMGEGLWPALLNDKWGFIDSAGTEIIPHLYDEIGRYKIELIGNTNLETFFNGLAMVMLNGKWGAVDKTGKLVIPALYERIEYIFDEISDGYIGKLNDEWHYFDDKGKAVRTTKTAATPGIKASGQPTASAIKILQPPLPMKGIVDTSLAGIWKYYDIEKNYGQNYSVYITFRADGTYDMHQDFTGSTPLPPPTNKNFWRIDGEYLEILYVGEKAPARLKLSKRHDVQRNVPVLVILWNPNTNDSRTFYPAVKK